MALPHRGRRRFTPTGIFPMLQTCLLYTSRANRRGILTHMDMPAVAADPHNLIRTLKDNALFQVFNQLAVCLLYTSPSSASTTRQPIKSWMK